jgi:alginate O-acetyltransferase complex protein AlgI
MLFPTITFAVFFLVVWPVSWLLMQRPRAWRPFIVVASYVFYGWWNWHFVFLLAGSTIGNQAFALALHRQRRPDRRKAILALAVTANLSILGYFKYFDFFLSSTHNVFNDVGLPFDPGLQSIILPVGISFFTFQALSYVIDTYRGDFEPVSFAKFAVYLSFFPHLVAGPIVRAREFIPQLATPRDSHRIDSSRAFSLLIGGLFKKVVIANFLASHVVDQVYGVPNQHSSLEVLAGVYGYAVQIWADFSGYTDMAIGLALLLGFVFPQNFDRPYTAASVQDFWRRWHMTLSRFLRDYLYIPLGGNRLGHVRTYVNLMLTMLIGGLWHGASWTFVVWGGIHGVGLCVERMWRWQRETRGLPEPADTGRRRFWTRFWTFQFVCFAWIFFRADSFSTAIDVIRGLFTRWGEASPLVTPSVVVAIAVGIGVQYVPKAWAADALVRFSRLGWLVQGAALGVALMFVDAMGPQGVAPFIYFRF